MMRPTLLKSEVRRLSAVEHEIQDRSGGNRGQKVIVVATFTPRRRKAAHDYFERSPFSQPAKWADAKRVFPSRMRVTPSNVLADIARPTAMACMGFGLNLLYRT